MFHLHVFKTLAHHLLDVAFLRRYAVLVRCASTRGALLGLLATLRPRLICRLLDAGDSAALGSPRQALLLRVGLCVLTQLLLVLVENTRGQPLKNPLVPQALIRAQALKWVPLEAATDKVDKLWVGRLPQLLHDILEAVLLLTIRDDL